VHLKSLTLRGFKSFASSTTLHLEPGITCVVGPNGSGKSNVVDAIAWVLGEQGAKALRGGTMSDVIFAGTPSRPALGRAEVLLTIDNTDGALPIEYSEVTVGRLMFRSGESEYTINGTACRLLDIQELMSDSGIGRELHVVVGQGQLDAVLQARPEDRRAFIEEAAGVLKHRKRKEKALRKLEAMAANLTRLTDLSAELRRQLGPLGRQAEIARKAGVIQATLRDARLRLAADDLVSARDDLASDVRDEEAQRTRVHAAEQALAGLTAREAELDTALAAAVPRATAAAETWYALTSLRERLRGTASLAAERARLLRVSAADARHGRDPDELEHEAVALREQEVALAARLEEDRTRLGEVTARRGDLERRLAVEEKELVAAVRAASARREEMARLTGKVEAARGRATHAEAEIARMSDAVDAARERAGQTTGNSSALELELEALSDAREEAQERYEAAVAVHGSATDRLEGYRTADRNAERDVASWRARREALVQSLAPKDGATALLAAAGGTGGANDAGDVTGAGERPTGILGRLATLLSVDPGAEVAVAAALGQAADALAVSSGGDAVAGLEWLRRTDSGRAALVVAGPADSRGEAPAYAGGEAPAAEGAGRPQPAQPLPRVPAGAIAVADLVRVSDPSAAAAVRRLLAGTVVVDDLQAALAVTAAQPGLRAVTRAGDILGPELAAGGSARTRSLVEVQAAAEEAAVRMAEAAALGDEARGASEAARDEVARTRESVDAALAARHETDARRRALSEQLGQLARASRAAAGETTRLEKAREQAEAARDRAYGALAELEAALSSVSVDPEVGERTSAERDRLVAATSAVRAEEVEARLALRTSEERSRGLSGRADGLMRAAANERSARAAALRRREVRERQAAVAVGVAEVAAAALERMEGSLRGAAAEREATEAARREAEAEVGRVREQVRVRAAELTALRDHVHRDELARAEKRVRVESLEAKALDEYGVTPDDLIAEYGPAQPVPPTEEDGETVPYDREEQAKRAATAERQLTRLGRVNPLALEEFAALQERAAFLSSQVDDLKNTRRDLLLVVDEVDARVREVFAAAFADTAREFEIVFATLFPGGEGRLVLTEPDDMLTTGIEVEARPPGKKVKRLSLLSGGERSLTAIALLLAIFRARPSPFYVLDEVEAALDDRNLGRLLEALEGLRARSQLVIITHQKRTMEIADALYGVSMRGDGVTTVISQRLRQRASA
jgi:chromosome segregation protein